ncbi:hypothetical protein H8K32_03635 [Undibacterium jejuense]|uniref:Uncharacterized protein n=1 Tax=Undibacterium jejuense TaxID=1344949 RepID=A0A923HC07_9BURK|nr:hypothetical protein [Undibacterium jejuense]MBC3861181.1 hypothetical protein [Undibacterium jejuense]
MLVNIIASPGELSYLYASELSKTLSLQRANAGRNVLFVSQKKPVWNIYEVKHYPTPYNVVSGHLLKELERVRPYYNDVFVTSPLHHQVAKPLSEISDMTILNTDASYLSQENLENLRQQIKEENSSSKKHTLVIVVNSNTTDDTTDANDLAKNTQLYLKSITQHISIQLLFYGKGKSLDSIAKDLYQIVFRNHEICHINQH